MENPQFNSHEQKFSSPEEELHFLREQVALRERELASRGAEVHKKDVVSDKLRDYNYVPTNQVLHESYQTPQSTIDSIKLNLAPETHDAKMSELINLVKEKGIKNTLVLIEALNDPHIEDDFHRFLVEYIKEGYFVNDLKPKSELFKVLHMTLYEISFPIATKEDLQKNLKELISSMEQFYSGMMSVADTNQGTTYFTLEIANPNHSEEFIFYVSVPDAKKDLFEKQILSLFPGAKLVPMPNDYNIFNEKGFSYASVAQLSKHPVLSLKTYEEFDHDPLNVILNTFSKIKKDGEGASLQLVFSPHGDHRIKEYQEILKDVEKGVPLKKALRNKFVGEFTDAIKDMFFSKSDKQKEEEKKPKPIDESTIKIIKQKISSPIIDCNIRIIASAFTENDAQKVLSDIESSFNQFENTGFNKITFKRYSGLQAKTIYKDYSFRSYSYGNALPLSIKEITTIFHFPGAAIKSSPQLKQAKAGSSAAPLDLPQQGTLLGVNKFRNIDTHVYLTKEDRLRHFYVIGQTGTGKSTLLKNMIIQDIQQGEGVCMIDPHGNDIIDVLSSVPKERYEDIIYFDPSYSERPMALNMLEYDRRFPEQKTFVVNELLSIFNKLFDMKTAGGPMFEQYFRNAVLLVIDDPDSGSTLLDVSKVLANKQFRELKLSKCSNPIVIQFWREVADKAGGEASLQNIVPYITSKFDVFLSNDVMRPIISQEQSSFNFREIMDSKKILLVNLAKGRLGDINANLIGLILVGKILMAALSRVDSIGQNLPPFYLYIDEFQNITTPSIATILSEARKYKLSMTIAHQFIAQLEDQIKNAVFGNVGSFATFRVGADDAEYLEKQFAPTFTAQDIINIENRNAYIKMLVNGRPEKPFNIETLPPPQGIVANIEKLKELSYLKFGRDRSEVEALIMEKYKKESIARSSIPKSS